MPPSKQCEQKQLIAVNEWWRGTIFSASAPANRRKSGKCWPCTHHSHICVYLLMSNFNIHNICLTYAQVQSQAQVHTTHTYKYIMLLSSNNDPLRPPSVSFQVQLFLIRIREICYRILKHQYQQHILCYSAHILDIPFKIIALFHCSCCCCCFSSIHKERVNSSTYGYTNSNRLPSSFSSYNCY